MVGTLFRPHAGSLKAPFAFEEPRSCPLLLSFPVSIVGSPPCSRRAAQRSLSSTSQSALDQELGPTCVAVVGITGATDHWCVVYRVTPKTLWLLPPAKPASVDLAVPSGQPEPATVLIPAKSCWFNGRLRFSSSERRRSTLASLSSPATHGGPLLLNTLQLSSVLWLCPEHGPSAPPAEACAKQRAR